MNNCSIKTIFIVALFCFTYRLQAQKTDFVNHDQSIAIIDSSTFFQKINEDSSTFFRIHINSNPCTIPVEQRGIVDIQKIQLSDIQLLSALHELDKQISSKDSLFSTGAGVFDVHAFQPGYPNEAALLRRYFVTPQYYELDKYDSDDSYPLYYAQIGKRIVYLRFYPLPDVICHRFSKKSKRKFRKMLEATLPQPEKASFYKLDGTEAFVDKTYRILPTFFHAGRVISVYQDRVEMVSEDKFLERQMLEGLENSRTDQ
jgi:hypothetical protein